LTGLQLERFLGRADELAFSQGKQQAWLPIFLSFLGIRQQNLVRPQALILGLPIGLWTAFLRISKETNPNS